MKKDKLKSCPFCGGEAEFHNCAEFESETVKIAYNGKIGVHCTQCKVATLPLDDESSAMEFWNRRTNNE